MNRKRVLSAVIALLLAIGGVVGLVAYVNAAKDRATSGEDLVEAFVVSRRVPAGTQAADIDRYVGVDEVPRKLVNSGTVGDLGDLDGLVTAVELLPGEVVSVDRWVSPTVFARDTTRVVAVPDGLQEVSLSLSPERAGGSLLVPGDTVGVFISFEPFDLSSDIPVEVDGTVVPPEGRTPNTTTLALHKVLVTNVQLEQVPEVVKREGIADEQDQDIRLVPSGNLIVTLAVDTFTAERLVFGAEFGSLWLSNEGSAAAEAPSTIQTRGTVYDDLDAATDRLGLTAVDGEG